MKRTLLIATATLFAAAAAQAQTLSPGQMEAAKNVFVGDATCHGNQQIKIEALADKPGTFKLTHAKKSYTLVPEETSTGAVRLEDKKAGMVWIQIPAKSMLMNAKLGQRVADHCVMAEQKAKSS
jgi:hypothetical protein